jgi:hypothetical protein
MTPNITVQITPPQMPTTPEEWQNAVDAAEALLHMESARMYGLVKGGPGVNVERCEELLKAGRRKGIRPRRNCVERLVGELNGQPKKR